MAAIDPLNTVPERVAAYTFKFVLTADQSQEAYIPMQVAFHPGTLILDTVADTKVEVSASSHVDLAAGTALWIEVTAAAKIVLDSTITGVRITNEGSNPIRVDLAI